MDAPTLCVGFTRAPDAESHPGQVLAHIHPFGDRFPVSIHPGDLLGLQADLEGQRILVFVNGNFVGQQPAFHGMSAPVQMFPAVWDFPFPMAVRLPNCPPTRNGPLSVEVLTLLRSDFLPLS